MREHRLPPVEGGSQDGGPSPPVVAPGELPLVRTFGDEPCVDRGVEDPPEGRRSNEAPLERFVDRKRVGAERHGEFERPFVPDFHGSPKSEAALAPPVRATKPQPLPARNIPPIAGCG